MTGVVCVSAGARLKVRDKPKGVSTGKEPFMEEEEGGDIVARATTCVCGGNLEGKEKEKEREEGGYDEDGK